jgi:hypothetical protein
MEPRVTWEALSETELWQMLNDAWPKMSVREQRLWELMRIAPQKWKQSPYGDQGGGFWAVAVIGSWVVWYNDIEDGFNTSRYSEHGHIAEYWCNQDKLDVCIRQILSCIDLGQGDAFVAHKG